MCFSVAASFEAGTVLSVIGVITLIKAHTPKSYLFACIPLIFAFQQTSEGFIWLSFMNPAYANWQKSMTCIFILFAQAVWPLAGPLSIWLIEKDLRRKKILLVLSYFGFLVSAYRIIWLCFYNVHSSIVGHHITYRLDPEASFSPYVPIIYFIATVIPPFVSSVKKMWAIGASILGSFIFTRIFYGEYLVSVWCFTAAIISALIFLILFDLRKSFIETPNFI